MWVLAVCIVLLWLFLRPGRYGEAQKQLVYGVNHAHRGLHTKDKTVPENSLPAFRAAAEAGYGVELDIQLSRDGQVVVFHDDTLDRVCGVHGRVDEFTFEELRGMRLCGTQETIPLLTEVFEVMGGRTPMIIELKTGRRNDELCEKGLALMRAYNGPYCIESFDPRIVRWFRKNAKDVLRGQLSDAPAGIRIGLPVHQRAGAPAVYRLWPRQKAMDRPSGGGNGRHPRMLDRAPRRRYKRERSGKRRGDFRILSPRAEV